MRDAQPAAPASFMRHIPREVITVVATAATIFLVVATGGLIASILPPEIHSPWLIMASYATPAAVAFVIHWWIDQRH